MPNKLDTKTFIEKSKLVHGNKYDYSLVDYKGTSIKVKIICPEHGIFEQTPNCHLLRRGCPKCYNNIKYTTNDFITKSKMIYGDKYDYSLVDYISNKIKVKIICPTHGIFEQRPDMFLQGHGCLKCSGCEVSNTKDFIEKAMVVHGSLYDYTKVKYVNAYTKVIIGCKIHGFFKQKPNSHLCGCGCPVCKLSKGEIKIKNFLDKYDITYHYQHRFKDLKFPFDFYLPNNNFCIEYDGIQHFEPIKMWGGFNSYESQLFRDKIKNDYCDKNGIQLLRISYKNFYEIEDILKTTILL